MFEAVEFPSEGALLRGRFYRPDRAAPFPAVVMTHGTTATITMALDRYAEVFRQAGLAVLLYDHRNFGSSGGEPRQEINPWIQARGYRDAVSYLHTRTDVRHDRIAIWGDSYSGLIALVAAALDRRVAAVAVQCPTCGAEKPNAAPTDESFQKLQTIFAGGDVRGTPATTTGPLPVVSSDQLGRRRCSSRSRHSSGSSTMAAGTERCGKTASPASFRRRRCRSAPIWPRPISRPRRS